MLAPMTTSDSAPGQARSTDGGPAGLGPEGSAPAQHPRAWWVLILDVLLILLFAVLGNRTHLSGLGVLDVLSTAAPFLLAWALSVGVLRGWRRPSRIWPEGLVILIGTVTLGLALRVTLGLGGAPTSFVLVTAGVLTGFLLGRRLLTGLLLRGSRG